MAANIWDARRKEAPNHTDARTIKKKKRRTTILGAQWSTECHPGVEMERGEQGGDMGRR